MQLYDSVFKVISELLTDKEFHSYPYDEIENYKEADKNTIIFKNDTAYELGSNSKNGLSGIAYTDKKELVDHNEVIVYGDDLAEIKSDCDYARIALVRVNDEKMGEGNTLYQNLRKIDYVRYHVSPEGFMVRISPMNQKESIRVSKSAIQSKISFAKVGKMFIDAYLKNEAVEACKIIFITLKDFPYDQLSRQIEKSNNITTALDHLLNKVKMDCNSCALQVVCNEVEELCKEDFKK